MFWHIDTDIVSLIVISAIYIYNKKALPSEEDAFRNGRFLQCLRVGIIATVIDIAASLVMDYPVNRIVYHLLMTAYFVIIELVMVAWLKYSFSILYHNDEERRKRIDRIFMVPYIGYLLVVLSNPWSGLIFTYGEKLVYRRGPLFFLMVAVYVLYSFSLLVITIIRGRQIPEGYPAFTLVLIPVVVGISVFVQLAVPGWLMILPGYMICLVLAFLFLQTRRVRDSRVIIQNLSTAAQTDQLTGLLNRAGMERRVRMSELEHRGSPCLVAVADVDDLKHINDTLGHPEGDIALQAVASMLKRHFRASDSVARFGGDEFVIYLTGAFNEALANTALKKLNSEITTLFVGEGDSRMRICVSVGAALGVVGTEPFEELCHRADIALYHVKRAGKNGFALHKESMGYEMPEQDQLRL